MSNFDKKVAIDEIRASLEERGGGIDLDTPFHWIVDDVNDVTLFFDKLPKLLPTGSILYIEGTSIVPEIAAFYRAHAAPNPTRVARDTIEPVPEIFHIAFSTAMCLNLGKLSQCHSIAEMFDHLKGYNGSSVFFDFHDAFRGSLRISEAVPANAMHDFCQGIGRSQRREVTKARDKEQLRALLEALENLEGRELVVKGDSWLRRILQKLRKC